MILSAKISRWWNVTPAQLEWVSLHLNQGETLVAEAAVNPEKRSEFLNLLSRHAPPVRVRRVEGSLAEGDVADALDAVTPSELYIIASDWWAKHKDDNAIVSKEIARIANEVPEEVTVAAISRAFGTPKPTLANSYMPELLNVRTFPTLMGYSSRIMAESWESNLLFYAALAHEAYMAPSQMNVVVPEWTQQTVEKIFATHLEDWPALLRSLRLVGDDVRTKARTQLAAEQSASLQ
jgi:hypothetical protein